MHVSPFSTAVNMGVLPSSSLELVIFIKIFFIWIKFRDLQAWWKRISSEDKFAIVKSYGRSDIHASTELVVILVLCLVILG